MAVYRELMARVAELASRSGRREVAEARGRATGRVWVVSIVARGGAATIKDQRRLETQNQLQEAASHPLVKAVMERFPGAQIVAVRDTGAAAHGTDTSAPEDAAGPQDLSRKA